MTVLIAGSGRDHSQEPTSGAERFDLSHGGSGPPKELSTSLRSEFGALGSDGSMNISTVPHGPVHPGNA
jgi:hypothetical protein